MSNLYCAMALSLVLSACGAPAPISPVGTAPPPTNEPEPEPEPTANWVPPELWGASTLEDLDDDPNVVEVRLTAAPIWIDLTDEIGFEGYGYNGRWPGPTLQAKVGDEVVVHFENQLPEPTTVHWHGLRIPDAMDGSPRIQAPVQPGETYTYRFVVPEAGTFWYHPHVRSNEQIEKGLYGTFVVREPDHPKLDAERVFVLDDILANGSGLPPFLASHPEQVHGRSGNVLLVNGRVAPPRFNVEKNRVELWRIVNTANARTMMLTLEGATFAVIGTDGGRLQEPYYPDRIELPVGQRYDLLVVYDRPGPVRLLSHVFVVDENEEVVRRPYELAVVEVAESDYVGGPIRWPAVTPRSARSVDREVVVELSGANTPNGIEWTINGRRFPEEPIFTFNENETVHLTITNLAGPEHPFHLHGQFFEVLDEAQPGLKDTVLVPGLETVEIVAYFDNPGRWMAHCHILEHAELGMMSEIVVEPR
ncbi:MAG: multicopper oxidase family protein [Deltaproteobacteria bacterium]|jgi:FtsP/CotA-like multicopper oxidase with cupredoxin domain